MRLQGWELALSAAVAEAEARPFVWGVHDCATWAFDVRRALTGLDAAAAWRGRYSTAAGSLRVIRRMGCADMGAAVTLIMGAPLADVRQAQRGDLLLLVDEVEALGVCLGHRGAFLGQAGLTWRAVSDCALAWRV